MHAQLPVVLCSFVVREDGSSATYRLFALRCLLFVHSLDNNVVYAALAKHFGDYPLERCVPYVCLVVCLEDGVVTCGDVCVRGVLPAVCCFFCSTRTTRSVWLRAPH